MYTLSRKNNQNWVQVKTIIKGGIEKIEILLVILMDNTKKIQKGVYVDEKRKNIGTAVDAMLAAQLASGKRVDATMYSKADINDDGKVTAIDAMLIARYASGKISSL